jgi:hypothetical protein
MGARIDFALGARDCLGMVASQYVCAPHAHSFAHLHVKKRYRHVHMRLHLKKRLKNHRPILEAKEKSRSATR